MNEKKNLEKLLRDQEKEIETFRDNLGYEKRVFFPFASFFINFPCS